MAEQMMTGIDEYHMIKEQVGGYYALFAAGGHRLGDRASYHHRLDVRLGAVLRAAQGWKGDARGHGIVRVVRSIGNPPRVRATRQDQFEPGVITCIPYCAVGVLMVIAVWREFRRTAGEASDTKLVGNAAA